MTKQLSKSVIGLFGLYLIFMAGIQLARYGVGLIEDLASGAGLPGDLLFDLLKMLVPLTAGLIAIKRAESLARIVAAPE